MGPSSLTAEKVERVVKGKQRPASDSMRMCAVPSGVAEHGVGEGLEVSLEEQDGLGQQQCSRKTEMEGGEEEGKEPNQDVRRAEVKPELREWLQGMRSRRQTEKNFRDEDSELPPGSWAQAVGWLRRVHCGFGGKRNSVSDILVPVEHQGGGAPETTEYTQGTLAQRGGLIPT